ncbi:hypothetical protein BU16DRAFT_531222 [Lophium mytilinum]|uniref:Uncharacterized protein n=1 Tax=Lophium mytilinum TaxID=390894 RepID=A0A6A6QCJ8_9PEZI|nr:hypothetical protein BU16DRAFT_531222 [Lophium mytilinum]
MNGEDWACFVIGMCILLTLLVTLQYFRKSKGDIPFQPRSRRLDGPSSSKYYPS